NLQQINKGLKLAFWHQEITLSDYMLIKDFINEISRFKDLIFSKISGDIPPEAKSPALNENFNTIKSIQLIAEYSGLVSYLYKNIKDSLLHKIGSSENFAAKLAAVDEEEQKLKFSNDQPSRISYQDAI